MAADQPEIWFYHLERASVEETLPALLEKCLERHWRCVVRCAGGDRIEDLDALLWTYKPNAWLPHARAKGEDVADARQPILLTDDHASPTTSQALFLLDGTDWTGAQGLSRIFVLFDGREQSDVTRARAHWQRAKQSGFLPAYWRQDGEGKWARN
jgi:DNA polymerase III subunit chi